MTKCSTIRIFFTGIIIIFCLAVVAAFVINQAQKSRNEIPVYGQIPQFSLNDMTGDAFSTQDMMGKICVVDFIFTNCRTACPVMSEQMSQLYHYYSASDKVLFLSITVDPDRDTEQVLQRYAQSHGVNDRRWIFLRGSIKDVIEISEKGFMIAAENLPMGHSTKFILIDPKGQIRGYFDALDENSSSFIKERIKVLAKAML